MATKRKRLTISLKPEDFAVIKRLAELQKRPVSGVVSDLVEAVMLPLMRTTALLDAAISAPDEIKHGLRETIEGMEAELQNAVGDPEAFFSQIIEQSQNPKKGDENAGT